MQSCKDHGFSYEWVSGQEPRLTKNGKGIICKTDNFVPLVVPGLSVDSGSSSSPTTPPQESLGPEAPPVSGNRAAELATRRLGQKSLISDKEETDPLADLPFWFQDFSDNPENVEVPAPAQHTSRDSDSEHLYKSGNEVEETKYFHSLPERPGLRHLPEDQIHKGPVQKTHWRSPTSSRKVW